MAALGVDPTIHRQVLAAARSVLATDARAPIARIAAVAGVSRATFYRHFGSRATLLAAIEHEAPPNARTRILQAAQEMLLVQSLADLSMEQLARAAGVSRGTIYRLFPGKPALLRAMVQAYSPFQAMLAVLSEHPDEHPRVLLPRIARAIVGVAEGRLGLMRAVLNEATSGGPASSEAVRPVLGPALAALTDYMRSQMQAGRLRRMDPFLALQAFIGPIYFHLMTRSVATDLAGLRIGAEEAADELVSAVLNGLVPSEPR
jgi:AcrR family transcriptional regulator